MATDADAKRRASFARAERLKKEAASQTDRQQQAEQPKARRRASSSTGERPRETNTKADQKKADQQKADSRTAEDQRKEAATRATFKRVEDVRRQTEQRRMQQRKDDTQKEFNRQAEDKKQTAAKEAVPRQAAQRQEATRKAPAQIAERQKQQQADQVAEHRRQTGEIRLRHRAETASLRTNEDQAINRHWHAVKIIDGREERALRDFDIRRASLTGRAVALVKGRAHVEREREKLQEGFEAERMKKHRDLEALKERQFAIAQETRLRQAHERKTIFENHRADRDALKQRQETDRPRLIEDRARAIEQVQDMSRTQQREHGQDHTQGMAH